jgi:hypothetical protein
MQMTALKQIAFPVTAIVAAAFVFAGCGNLGDGGSPEPVDRKVLGPGKKADDFRSQSAREYYVEGTATIELQSEYQGSSTSEKRNRVEELIQYKQVVIGYFLNTYLVDKSDHNDNQEYGGFHALTKNGSYENMNLRQTGPMTWKFDFVQEVGGQMDLLEALSRRANATQNRDGSYSFDLAVGNVSNDEMTNLSSYPWYRKSEWSDFSPNNTDASKYSYKTIRIRPQERSDDAWIDYNRLFADGTVNVGLFFGWDYHDDFHQQHSKNTYKHLLERGFTSPVDSWDAYAENRAPLTKTITADGEEVTIKVTIWWGEPGTSTDPSTDAGGRKLEQAMRESFRANEITAFNGHSGPWHGFALANWRETREGEIDDTEVPGLEMPDDTYQLVLAKGCDTYALGEAFWKNPNKSDRTSLDILTTTSFSSAGTHRTVTDLLDAVIATDSDGSLEPGPYSRLLEDMDSNSYWFETMYGVHGIDDNPTGHPFADRQNVCSQCTSDADCGGTGNACVNLEGNNVCTYSCTADRGCPDGYTCRETQTGGSLSGSVCVPSSFSCQDVRSGGQGPDVRVTEVLADPAMGSPGDANGDGERDAYDDEFVELKNTGQQTVDLSGWKLRDNVSVRETLPADLTLNPGETLVIFGGGSPAEFSGLPSDAIVLAGDGLYLNNGGDVLEVIDHNGEIVDRVRWGSEGGENKSMVRDGESLTQSDTMTPGE